METPTTIPTTNTLPQSLRKIRLALTLLVIASAGILYRSNLKRQELPRSASQLLAELSTEPEQSENEERAFTVNWRGAAYVLYPVADYEITGLVVSRNDIGGFIDVYHTTDSVDVVDLCLVWGENADPKVYLGYEFWSEPFSCWIRERRDVSPGKILNQEQLSNTHLLPKDETIARTLSGVHLGDQVRLAGRLVNYHPSGASEQMRRSSLRRDDSGNGACEVMYVESVEILSRNAEKWNEMYSLSKKVLIGSGILWILAFLFFPYLEYRAMDGGT